MNERIQTMLNAYNCTGVDDYHQALREIIQEAALAGLARGGFFAHAAFTGGTALRIFHGLDRFSEDLDFSLQTPDPSFDIADYLPTVENELRANGFEMSVERKRKGKENAIQSAFLKEGTLQILARFTPLDPPIVGISCSDVTKVKIEIDTNPPVGATFEERFAFLPSPYAARLLDLPSMFATKIHAVLCRGYLKGRDYYDFLFFVQKGAAVNVLLLENALRQTGKWVGERRMILDDIKDLLAEKFEAVDYPKLKRDVMPFLRNPADVDFWSAGLFKATLPNIEGA